KTMKKQKKKKTKKNKMIDCKAIKKKKLEIMRKMKIRSKKASKKSKRKIKLIINSKGGYNMAINLKQDIMQNFNNKKKDYMNVMRSEDSTPEQLEESFSNMFDALQNDLAQKITSEAKDEVHDAQI